MQIHTCLCSPILQNIRALFYENKKETKKLKMVHFVSQNVNKKVCINETKSKIFYFKEARKVIIKKEKLENHVMNLINHLAC